MFKKIIPFVCENLITVPLWEEGDYSPSLNIWQLYNEVPFDSKKEELVNQDYNFIPKGYAVYFTIKENYGLDRKELNELLALFDMEKKYENIQKEKKCYVEYNITSLRENEIDFYVLFRIAERIIEEWGSKKKK